MKLTVIVPIYNVEGYLSKCIESIVNQTYKNLEILLVNDGSTDGCLEICNAFALKDSRINVINKENGGLSSARNAGLDIASGDYIAFVDSDDYIDIDMYENLINLLKGYDADIAACGIKEIFINSTYVHSNTAEVNKFNREEVLESLVKPNSLCRFEVWNKIFKSDLIKEVRFKPNQIYEDVYFDRKILFRLNTLVYIDKPMYNYLKERVGNTNSFFKKNRLSIFDELNDFVLDLKSEGLVNIAKSFESYLVNTIISFYIDATKLNADIEMKKQLLSLYESWYYRSLINRKCNKFKLFLFKLFPNFYVRAYLLYKQKL